MKRFSLTLALSLLVLCPAFLDAQDRPTHPDLFDNQNYNGTFNRSNQLWNPEYCTTEYTWVSSNVGNGLVDGGKLSIGSDANNYNYQHFFHCIGHGATQNSSNNEKRFLIVNGYGGDKDYWHPTNNTPSNKKILQYRVQNVQPNVMYDLKFWAVNLSNGQIAQLPGYYARVKFRIQCNGSNVHTTQSGSPINWEPEHTLDQAIWRESPVFRMNSGNSTQLLVTFYDDCVYTAGSGDDFGIDDVSLRLAPEYNVTAQSFTAPMACLSCDYPAITLQQGANGHFNTTLPSGAPTTPPIYTAIRKGDTDQWVTAANTTIQTSKGTVYIDPNNNLKFHYTPSNNAHGGDTDSFQYRITRFGLSASATITITMSDVPTLNTVSGIPDDAHVCMQALTSFNPSATWNANGSAVTNSGWEWRPANSSYWHASSTWNSNLVSPGNYYIHFYANNDCTSACETVAVSEDILVRVCDIPVLSSTSISNPPTLCGANASLPSSYLQHVSVQTWNNDTGTARWEVSHNNGGTWVPFTETTLQNNDKLRYHAFNQCGDAVTNSATVNITNGPSFTQNTPSFEDWYCSGAILVLPTPPTFNPNGIIPTDQYWAYSSDGGNSYVKINGNPTLTEAWDSRYICYILEFDCGGAATKAYSSPQRQLTVYGAPEFIESLAEIGHPFCVGENLTVSDLQVPAYASCPDASGYWEISSGSSQSGFQPFTLPRQLTAADNNKWIQYHAVGCGETTSNAIQIEVHDAPTIATPATPAAICAGNSFNLTVPHIQNYGLQPIDQGWQIAPSQNGSFVPFDNNEVTYDFNHYWIRYFAENDCSTGYSQSVQVTVNDSPIVDDITAPDPICAGESFNLTAPTVNWRHVNQGTGGWEIADPSIGDFQPLNNNNIAFSFNGNLLRYRAVNGCDTTYSNIVPVTVYSTDPIYEDTIVACDDLMHHGVMCNHTGDYSATISSPDGCDITAYWHFELGDAVIAPMVRDTACLAYYWPRTHRYYYTTGVYDTTLISTDPMVCDSVFSLNVVINHAPEIINAIQQNQVQPICEHGDLNFPLPTVNFNYLGSEPFGGYWMAAPTIDGEYQYFFLEDVAFEYDQWWVKYVAENACGTDESQPVQISVRKAPVIDTEVPEMGQVCVGNVLPLPQMTVIWNGEAGSEGWYLSAPEGNAIPIDGNTPMQMAYNGWNLYYVASNSCGDIPSNQRTLTIINKPSVQEIPGIPGVCAGGTFDLPELMVNWNGDTGHGVWQVSESPSGPFTNFSNNDIPYAYNNYWLRYKATNACGSDTSRMVQVQVFPSDDLEETMQACNPMQVYGFYCDHDDDYVKDSITENGCHVTFTLHFSMGEQFEYPTVMAQGCGDYYWDRFGLWFDETTDFDTIVSGGSALACDTLYSIHVDITQPNALSVFNEQHCTEYFWEVNGMTYSQSAIDTFYRPNGSCIDTLVLRLTIAPLEEDTTVVRCQEYFWPVAGQWIEVGETADTVVFDPVSGCNVHYRLNVVEGDDTYGTTEEISTCEPYEWHGTYYQESGVYTFNNVDPETGCYIIDSLKLDIMGYSNFDIQGETQVAVTTSFWPGIYFYTVELENEDPIHWQLLDANWAYDTLASGKTCWVEVTSPGTGRLVAMLGDGGCNSDTIYINASHFGVEELPQPPVSVYPNPAKHLVTVESENIQMVRVFDMFGQLVQTYSCHGDAQLTFDISGYSANFYIVEVQTPMGIVRKPLSVYR